jgi:hypothetical protein
MQNQDSFLMLNDSEMSIDSKNSIAELAKALLAPGSVSDMYTAPGGSLTMQSLEGMLANLTLSASDFTFWQDINKIKAFSTVEEYDQQIGLGISDGGFVGQMENPEFQDADFLKQIAIVKFMSEGWKVADVQEATQTIIDVRTRQQRSAMNRLLRNLDRSFYNGNSLWIPESIDGLSKTIAATSSQQVFDMRGGNVTMATFNLAGQLITEGNGHAENSKIYVSPAGVQNLSTIIESTLSVNNNFKVIPSGNANITIGGKITEIMTNYGAMKPRMDKILGLEFEAQGVPQYYNNTSSTWVEGATSEKAPSVPTIAVATVGATVAGSLWTSTGVRPSGATYRFRVSARNKYGRSIACALVAANGNVATAGSIAITITPNPNDAGDKIPTCFVIYSEQVAGSGIFRYMDTIAASTVNPLAAVVYTDLNAYIPGTARMYVIDQTTAGEDRVLAYSQLLPIHNTDLAKLGRYSQGLINLYGAMKYYKPQVLVEIRNIGVTQSNPNLFNTI